MAVAALAWMPANAVLVYNCQQQSNKLRVTLISVSSDKCTAFPPLH